MMDVPGHFWLRPLGPTYAGTSCHVPARAGGSARNGLLEAPVGDGRLATSLAVCQCWPSSRVQSMFVCNALEKYLMYPTKTVPLWSAVIVTSPSWPSGRSARYLT